jgi:hypothetical protein
MVGLITQYGLALIFADVLIQQLGLPVPALPMLIVAGALAADGKISALALFAVAFVACTISLHRLVAEGHRPVIVDLRTPLVRNQDSRCIPDATLQKGINGWTRFRPIARSFSTVHAPTTPEPLTLPEN